MKLPPKSIDKAPKKIDLDIQDAVGRDGGVPFSSGCNLSGVKTICIWQRHFDHKEIEYPSTIKRIWLGFNTSLTEDAMEPVYGAYARPENTVGDKPSTLRLQEGDSILQVKVWTDGNVVCAIQFYMKSGSISQIYGSPLAKVRSNSRAKNIKVVKFRGKTPDAKLVGIHGRYDTVINRLGFTFASEEVAVEEDSSFATEDVIAGISAVDIASVTNSEATSWTDVEHAS